MSIITNSLTAGAAILAGLSAQAQEGSSLGNESAELAAEVMEQMVIEGQIKIDSSGGLKIDKSIFEVLRERGVLKEISINRGSTDTGSQKCKSM